MPATAPLVSEEEAVATAARTTGLRVAAVVPVADGEGVAERQGEREAPGKGGVQGEEEGEGEGEGSVTSGAAVA